MTEEYLSRLASLVNDSVQDPWTAAGVSDYDTAQLVRLSRFDPAALPERMITAAVEALSRRQNPDGTWGSVHLPLAFRVVPTVAAAAALAGIRADQVDRAVLDRAVKAALRGVDALTADPSRFDPTNLPDLVAVEFTVPSLLEDLRESFERENGPARAAHRLPPDTRAGRAAALSQTLGACLPFRERLEDLRTAVRVGGQLPVHINHSLEVLSAPPAGLRDGIEGLPVGCSAAATAALVVWTGGEGRMAADALGMLTEQVSRLDGMLPVIMHMDTFDLLWVLTPAVRLGLPFDERSRERWARGLARMVEPGGVRPGPALVVDGDDTAAALYAGIRLGAELGTESMMRYWNGDSFFCYPRERTRSTTTNAHALEVLGAWARRNPGEDAALPDVMARTEAYLLDSQLPDGSWADKWHGSPVYSTCAVACALHEYGSPAVGPAVARALGWLRDNQRPDGSWGRWHGTSEETAYGLHLLLSVEPDRAAAQGDTVRRALSFLDSAADAGPADAARVPLWVGKELFNAPRIESAAVLAARWRVAVAANPSGGASRG